MKFRVAVRFREVPTGTVCETEEGTKILRTEDRKLVTPHLAYQKTNGVLMHNGMHIWYDEDAYIFVGEEQDTDDKGGEE